MSAGIDEAKMIELESKILHQDFEIEKLQKALALQEKSVYQLELKMTSLIEKIKDVVMSTTEVPSGNVKPPHY